MSKLVQQGLPADAGRRDPLSFGLDVRALDTALALSAGAMFPITKRSSTR